jgi:uncharacterized integral membrane protein
MIFGIYKTNPKTLKSENITLNVILSLFGFALVGALIGGLFMTKRVDNIKYITEETKQIIIREQLVENEFTP